ncbi:IMP cyclohydrolase [Eubacteriales bacterium KG127]
MQKITVEQALKGNSYPGRGIILGKSKGGLNAVAVYFIMGRSENSRNRIFVEDDGDIMIRPFDESKVEDPSLIVYYPMRSLDYELVVTNGDQTDTVYNFIREGESFEEALQTREFEPDAPNFTPRISGVIELNEELTYKLSILKAANEQGEKCHRFFYNYEATDGEGHLIHTYQCDGNPLPTYEGEPKLVEIEGTLQEFADRVWNSLDDENKISLVAKSIDLKNGRVKTYIINKNIM